MMTEMSASAACSVLASVSSACLKARDWAANGSGPTYRVLPSALSVSTAWGKGMTYPCGGNDNSGLRSSPLAYSGHISGGSDRSGVCEVPIPSTILAMSGLNSFGRGGDFELAIVIHYYALACWLDW